MKAKPAYTAVFLSILLMTFMHYSCQKESSKIIPINDSHNAYRQSGCNFDVGFVCSGAIPEFGSQQDFDDAYACLEQEYEDYNDSMEAAHSTLTDDAYDDFVDSVGFNEEATLDSWETAKGYTSWRTVVNAAEASWIAGGMTGTDPFDNAISDLILMTLLNEHGNVKIGGSIFHIDADGSQIEVTNADCEELENALSDPHYTSDNIRRITISASTDTCKLRAKETSAVLWTHDVNRKFLWRVDFDSYISNSRAKSLMRNFRRKNGNWKKAAARSYVYVGGHAWNSECNQRSAISYDDKTKRRKRVGVRVWPPDFSKIRTGDIQGTFKPTSDGPQIDTAIHW